MVKEKIQNNSCWYVVRARPKQEDRADFNLRTLDIETFNPKLRERRSDPCLNQPRYSNKPLFPGYIFARFEAENMLNKVCFTRGVRSVVNFGNGPVQVDEGAIHFIKSYVNKDGYISLCEKLNSGDKVAIASGPFKDLGGIFERKVKATNRVLILLSTVGYQVHVELERDLVRKEI
jgi:transcriptional antiterminator RfaH